MELAEVRTVLDFGMVVILWLVQLVIYPSFLTCEASRLVAWHKRYTRRVAWVIMPIMFTQLPLVVWFAWSRPGWSHLIAMFCVALCWVLTFAVSVPLHRKIDAGDTDRATLQRLIATNWPRTILWTMAFFLGLS